MQYAPKEPHKKVLLAGVFLAVALMVLLLVYGINRFVIKENLVLKKPMTLLLIGTDLNILAPKSQDNPNNLPRTDTLILAFIDPARHKLSLISIPRDSLVDIPGHGLDRINQASVLGGYRLTKKAITVLTGVKVDRYAAINFDGFKKLIDLVGGVTINVDKKMRYATEPGRYNIKLDPGPQALDGEKALEYVRFRNEPLGDISRVERQRQLLLAIYRKILQSNNLMKTAKLLELGRQYVHTDLTTKEMLQLSGFANQVNPDKDIVSATLPGKFFEAYWQPDPDKVYKLIKKCQPINPKK
ncbi:MAG: LCP family protein [Bacillota bacterium]